MLEIQCNRDDVKIAKVVDGAWECKHVGNCIKKKETSVQDADRE